VVLANGNLRNLLSMRQVFASAEFTSVGAKTGRLHSIPTPLPRPSLRQRRWAKGGGTGNHLCAYHAVHPKSDDFGYEHLANDLQDSVMMDSWLSDVANIRTLRKAYRCEPTKKRLRPWRTQPFLSFWLLGVAVRGSSSGYFGSVRRTGQMGRLTVFSK
jgi:hypothetical protein